VLWARAIALTWPIVVLRELEFHWDLTNVPVSPAVPWAADVATALLLGILWFDWLCLIALQPKRFRTAVVAPMLAGWAVASAVAAYQMFGDLEFLNRTLFGAIGRAGGTMRDANAFGAFAALCGAAWVAFVYSNARARIPLMLAGLLASWVGVWASGSRTALAAAAISLAFVLHAMRNTVLPKSRMGRIVALGFGVLAVALFVTAVSLRDISVVGPLRRVLHSLPGMSVASVTAFSQEMWNRNGYGVVATDVIRDFPLFGVGVSGFQSMVPLYATLTGISGLPPDNAQNWFRHQFTEFGLVGSIGWIAWVIMFVSFVWRARPPDENRFPARVVLGAILALTAISLVGMPTQNATVAITFWVLAFWYLKLADGDRLLADDRPIGKTTWMAMATLLAVFVTGTVYSGLRDLRPAERAARAGWDYSWGFSHPEPAANGGEQRWAAQRGLVVLKPTAHWLKVTIHVNHRDIGRRPVDAKVWCDRRLILRPHLTDTNPVSAFVEIPEGKKPVILETWVSRVVRPADYGVQDRRSLGLIVQWEFVSAGR
jgi:hypothetical protein